MPKILKGKVISNKMEGTVVVEVSRIVSHPLYKKLLKRSKKYKVDYRGEKPVIGQTVNIAETRPVSKDKHFALLQPVKPKESNAKTKQSKAKKSKKV